MKLTAKQLNDLFDYRDGDLYWKPQKAGTIDGSGYVQTGIKGKYYKNHRLIFLMHHGYLPEVIDHIDGDKTNNRIENLREASRAENNYNSRKPKHNKSGIKGVHWVTWYGKWRARFNVDKKVIDVGYFDDIEEARKAIVDARKKHHKKFANNG